jgi:acyl-CoA synthetase (AMP-forming)/AMP-acid ligase II
MKHADTSETKQIVPLSSWPIDHLGNVGHCLSETARRLPAAIAVVAPRVSRRSVLLPRSGRIEHDAVTFEQLEATSNQIANGIRELGVAPGTRLALMVPPGIDFVAHVFGLFKAGVVVVLIDPGMGKRNMLRCLAAAAPGGIVGIARAHVARLLFRRHFPECKLNVVVGRKSWPGCHSADNFAQHSKEFPPLDICREDPAAVIFTTGSTGPPKGVLYRHRVFLEQAAQIQEYFAIQPGSTDVSGFPLFALFNTAMGTTTIFPKMDPTRPADVHPPDIMDAVERFNADQSFGSPALWNTVSLYCESHAARLPSIKRVLTAGAPVAPKVLQRIKQIIAPDGEAFTPYGATEALPVACISATEVLRETAARTNLGAGTCVGKRFPKISWRVIRIADDPISDISAAEELPVGEIGELIVQGVVVTDQYVTRAEANALHKIRDGSSFWHRMGDVGYLDEQDRFWFCGRKGHRVQTTNGTMFTIPCEAIINTHPDVYRSALVGVGERGNETPVVIAEPWKGKWPRDESRFVEELRQLAARHDKTSDIKHFLLQKSLPVDIRHNSKIFREQLREWAQKRI